MDGWRPSCTSTQAAPPQPPSDETLLEKNKLKTQKKRLKLNVHLKKIKSPKEKKNWSQFSSVKVKHKKTNRKSAASIWTWPETPYWMSAGVGISSHQVPVWKPPAWQIQGRLKLQTVMIQSSLALLLLLYPQPPSELGVKQQQRGRKRDCGIGERARSGFSSQ